VWSSILTVRLTPEVERRLTREARRQSLLAGAQDADRETLAFIEHAGDPRGWKSTRS
jgi:hypothetical protein